MGVEELSRARASTWAMFARVLLGGAAEIGADEVSSPWLQVPPHADVYFSEEGQLGGPCAAAARRAMESAGFRPAPEGLPADHLGLLCGAMAHLESAHAEALAADREAMAERVSDRAMELLRAQLLPWLPALAVAVQRECAPVWGELMTRLVRLAASYEVPPVAAPDRPPSPLDVPGAGVREAAIWLARPRLSGWWLSPRALVRAGVPTTGGSRARQLEQLLIQSSEAGRLEEVREVLIDELMQWREGYARMSALGLPVQAWFMRMSVTGVVLRRLDEVVPAVRLVAR
jgi:hypothetical protein